VRRDYSEVAPAVDLFDQPRPRRFAPQSRDLPEIRVQRNARVIQVRDLTFFRLSLVARASAGEDGAGWPRHWKRARENGWDALPLAPKELHRLFPELWGTDKAAEDWGRKNPLNSCISIIRVWGSLTLSSSRPDELVKGPGAAWGEPEGGARGVLGLRAEYIQVRELRCKNCVS
jgi:hypothetical protein